ncbi:MAG: LytTR family DNA-binding domain-containing protein [Oscillospiraceae bacterium]
MTLLKVEIKISSDIKEPYAVIYSDAMTDEIQTAVFLLGSSGGVISVTENERIIVLQPKEIFMVRVENEKTLIYSQTKTYLSGKRLYELETQLGKDFMRISKSTLVNLKEISCIEPSFNGLMLLILKNGCRDYISRKYLPEFKKYLGL